MGFKFDYNTKYRVEAQVCGGLEEPLRFRIYTKVDNRCVAELYIDEKTVRANYCYLTPSVKASMVSGLRKRLPTIKYNYFN